MAISVPKSRQQLTSCSFCQLDAGDWKFEVKKPYDQIFTLQESHVMKDSSTGWRTSKDNQRIASALFPGLGSKEIERINRFRSDYERMVLLSLNSGIRSTFDQELDACLALNYTWMESQRGVYTPTHKLEYEAKYQNSVDAFERLTSELYRGLLRLPADLSKEKLWISHIPHELHSEPPFSTKLARALANRAANYGPWESVGLITSSLTRKKLKTKDLDAEEKLSMWQEFVNREQIRLDYSVEGRQVVVVDDLYQSGATIWSYAQFLKRMGAHEVLGLVCSKSWRDTDNK